MICIYIYIYIYIYITLYMIYPPALLVRGHQTAKRMLQTACSKSLQSFPVCNCQFASLVSALSCLQVSNLVFGNYLLDLGTNMLPPPGCVISTWALPGYPWRVIEVSSLSPRPSKIRRNKSCQKATKRLQNEAHGKAIPQDTKIVNKSKKSNHQKNAVFMVVIAHATTTFRQHFHRRISKNMDLETVSQFGTPNQRQITNMSPK